MKISKEDGFIVIEKDGISESFINMNNFKRVMLKMISEAKFNIVFKATYNKITIKSFFVDEAIFLLEWYLSSKKEGYHDFINRILPIIKSASINKDQSKIKDTLDYKQIDSKMNFKILEHQKKAFVNYLKVKDGYNLRGYLLEAGIGTGKTFSSMALSEALHSAIRIIVCQSIAIDEVWADALTGEMYKDKYKRPYYNIKSGKEYNGEKDIICNYEQLMNLLDVIPKLPKGKKVLIVDEIHKFNDVTGKSQRPITLSKVVTKFEPDDVILLSGTPIKQSAKEMVNLLRILDPRFTRKVEKDYTAFYKRGSNMAMYAARYRYSTLRVKIAKTEMKLPPIKDEDVLIKLKNGKHYTITAIRERLREYTKKRTKEISVDFDLYLSTYESLRDLAFTKAISNSSTTREDFAIYKRDIATIIKNYKANTLPNIPTEISRANAYEKDVLLKHLSGDVKIAFKDAKSVVKYLSLKVAGEAIGRVVTKARNDCAIDLVNALNINQVLNDSSKKVIFFSKFVSVAETIYTGRESYIIPVYGEHLKRLKSNMVKFRDGLTYKAISATFSSLSTAITIVEANTIVMCDLLYRDYEYQQAIGRVWRLGQDETVHIKHLMLNTEEQNITNRDFDIMSLSAYNSEYITGLAVDIDEIPDLKDTAVLQPKEFIDKIRKKY